MLMRFEDPAHPGPLAGALLPTWGPPNEHTLRLWAFLCLFSPPPGATGAAASAPLRDYIGRGIELSARPEPAAIARELPASMSFGSVSRALWEARQLAGFQQQWGLGASPQSAAPLTPAQDAGWVLDGASGRWLAPTMLRTIHEGHPREALSLMSACELLYHWESDPISAEDFPPALGADRWRALALRAPEPCFERLAGLMASDTSAPLKPLDFARLRAQREQALLGALCPAREGAEQAGGWL